VPGTEIRFYVGNTLKATHTTNMPTAASPATIKLWASSSDAAGQIVTIRNNYRVAIRD